MRKVTKLTGFFIVPLGVLLFLQAYLMRDNSLYDAVVTTSAGLLGMLPKGLYLLISIGLAAGIVHSPEKMCWCRICTRWKIWRMWTCSVWIRPVR